MWSRPTHILKKKQNRKNRKSTKKAARQKKRGKQKKRQRKKRKKAKERKTQKQVKLIQRFFSLMSSVCGFPAQVLVSWPPIFCPGGVEKYGDHTPEWWVANMDLIFDGVTLTKAPQCCSNRQKHAAQAIKAMWMKKGEAMSPDVHTYNRYFRVIE